MLTLSPIEEYIWEIAGCALYSFSSKCREILNTYEDEIVLREKYWSNILGHKIKYGLRMFVWFRKYGIEDWNQTSFDKYIKERYHKELKKPEVIARIIGINEII